MTNAMQINGLEQLQKLMAELPDKVQKQVAVYPKTFPKANGVGSTLMI